MDNILVSFGSQEYGQLGDGNEKVDIGPPFKIPEFSNIIDIAAGLDHSLALNSSGEVYGWGFNREGQLGLGQDSTDLSVPTKVNGINNHIVRVYCGLDNSFALTDTGEYYAWGSGEMYQLGNNECDIKLVPQKCSIKNERIIDLAPGGVSTIALTESGNLYSWGNGDSGKLGHGDETPQQKPKKIAFFSDNGIKIKAISGKGAHHIALSTDGDLYSWGLGLDGRLGNGESDNIFLPTKINFFKDKKIHLFCCGLDHSLVVTEE